MYLLFFLFNNFRKFKSKQKIFTFNFYISFFLISFSIFSLILSESFTKAYKIEVINKYKAFNLDYKINDNYSSFISKSSMIKLDSIFNIYSEKKSYSPYIESNAILYINHITDNKKYSQREGVYVRGLQNNLFLNNKFNQNYLIHNNFYLDENSIIIGEYLSNKINKSINDTISLLIKEQNDKIIFKNLIISNIYKTGIKSDEFIVFLDFNTLSKLIYKDDKYYGCDGFIVESNSLIKENFLEKDIFKSRYNIENWDSLNYNLLKFLNFFDIPIKTITWLLMFLSIYSLSAFISNMMIEKRNDFKILYFLGFNNKYAQYLVLTICLYFSIIASLFGSFIALIVLLLQKYFQFIAIPSERIFQVSVLPVNIDTIIFFKYPFIIIIITIPIVAIIIKNNFKLLKINN